MTPLVLTWIDEPACDQLFFSLLKTNQFLPLKYNSWHILKLLIYVCKHYFQFVVILLFLSVYSFLYCIRNPYRILGSCIEYWGVRDFLSVIIGWNRMYYFRVILNFRCVCYFFFRYFLLVCWIYMPPARCLFIFFN